MRFQARGSPSTSHRDAGSGANAQAISSARVSTSPRSATTGATVPPWVGFIGRPTPCTADVSVRSRPVVALAPRPMVAYTAGWRARSHSPHPTPASATTA